MDARLRELNREYKERTEAIPTNIAPAKMATDWPEPTLTQHIHETKWWFYYPKLKIAPGQF